MREYNYTMKKALSIGLRKTERNKRGQQALVLSTGMVPDDGALSSLELMTQLNINAISPAPVHPYPQIFQLKQLTLLCSATAIYEVSTGLTLTLLLGGLLEGHMWSCADFHNYIVLANGRQVVTRDGNSLQWSADDTIGLSVASSVCNFNGQLIAAAPNVAIV